MKLHSMFSRDIARSIEGVIKADDESNLVQEVDEYIITKELERKLDPFFGMYSGSLGKQTSNSQIGIWISGFFGSGKSHLLKMLSYLLANKVINAESLINVFLKKLPPDDFELTANIAKLAQFPSQTILFNIEQKSNKSGEVLPVFVKVFNELRGYYSGMPFVANFERDLDQQGLLKEFKDAYQTASGKDWNKGREEALLESDTIASALQRVKGIPYEEALEIMPRYEQNYQISVEDFVNQVKAYIGQQPPNFRLIFCVDEIGQYISNDPKLMLNLQTTAETLASKCQGQAWLIVTSQEDIDTMVGDLTAKQAHDFSRIQARFPTRLDLSSANVDEVIQKRLLDKTPEAKHPLKNLYVQEGDNLRTMFHFTDGSRQYRGFLDDTHFVNCYPFVPYQFDLFQSAIRGLSKHNVFQGKHLSVGERSMLSAFQWVAKKIADDEMGRLVAFDQMYDGIRTTMRSQIASSIIQAENQLDPFDVRVLKALFMVKYVQEFKASARNISILLIQHINEEILPLEQKALEALNRLRQQSYVQELGGVYEFLTDKERDVENEIKAMELDPATTNSLLSTIIFKELYADTKIRYEVNKQDYGITRRVDYHVVGRETDDLGLHIITPLCDREITPDFLKAESMGRPEIFIHLPDDIHLRRELELHQKTERYINQTRSTTLGSDVQSILEIKGRQNSERRTNLSKRIRELIGQATVYLNGSALELTTTHMETKIVSAFQQLIGITYPHLGMIKRIYKEEDIKRILLQQADDLFRAEESMSESEQEIFNLLQRKKQLHERMTTKSLLEHFSHRPYGWYPNATLCLIVQLFMRSKFEITHNNQELNRQQLLPIINNSREYGNVIINLVPDIPTGTIGRFKAFYHDLFDEGLGEIEPRGIVAAFKIRLNLEISVLQGLLNQKSSYHFLAELESPIQALNELSHKELEYLLNQLADYEDRILDCKEKVIDPIKQFMNGERKTIYDDVLNILRDQQANLDYLGVNPHVNTLYELKETATPYKTGLNSVKQDMETLRQAIRDQVASERQKALDAVGRIIDTVRNYAGFMQLTPAQQQQVLHPFDTARTELQRQELIPVIRERLSRIEQELHPAQLNQINKLLEANKPIPTPGAPVKPIIITRPVKAFKDVQPKITKKLLENEADVTAYITALQERLLQEIRSNNQILLS